MRPHKVADGQGEPDADRNIELVEVVSQLLPMLSHFHADIGQKITPGQRTEKGKEYKPINVYTGDAGRQRDEGPDDRKHPAEKNSCLAILCEPSIRHLDVFSRYQHIGPVSFDERPTAQDTDVVGHKRPRNVTNSAGQCYA